MPSGLSTLRTPPTIRPKNGSPKKRLMNGSSALRVSASERTSATAPERRVTNVRAAWFGTYPVATTASQTTVCRAGSTLRMLLMTRDTVARETPAAFATSSRVGCRPGSLMTVITTRPEESALLLPMSFSSP